MKVSTGKKVFMYCWMMEEPLHPARIAALFLNGIMKEENDNGENGSAVHTSPICGRSNLYIFQP
jgi:hypothetical protein